VQCVMQADETVDPRVEVDAAAAYLEPASLLQDGARPGLLIRGGGERKRRPRPGPWCYPENPGPWCYPENPQDQLALASRFQPAACRGFACPSARHIPASGVMHRHWHKPCPQR